MLSGPAKRDSLEPPPFINRAVVQSLREGGLISLGAAPRDLAVTSSASFFGSFPVKRFRSARLAARASPAMSNAMLSGGGGFKHGGPELRIRLSEVTSGKFSMWQCVA
jgi:hypothetical protein